MKAVRMGPCVTFLLLIGCACATDIHKGVQWNKIKDSRWPTPRGTVYNVSSVSEINGLQDQLEPGDVMVMQDGEWADARITLRANGTAGEGNAIYLEPQTYGGVKLTGDAQIDITGHYIEVRGMWFDGTSDLKYAPVNFAEGSSRCRFTNSAITNFNRATDPFKHHWVELWGSYHTVDYLALEDKGNHTGQLIRVKTTPLEDKLPGDQPDSWGHWIHHNYFGPRPDTLRDDGEGIQIGLKESEWVNTETLVEWNYFDRYDAEVESISVKGSNNTIRWNTFKNSSSLVTLRHSDNTRVQENYFYCDGKLRCGGVRIYGEHHVVINNYIEGATGIDGHRACIGMYTGDQWDHYKRVASNNKIIRNLCYQCLHSLYVGRAFNDFSTDFPTNNVFERNLMTGRNAGDVCYREITNKNATFTMNNVWNCYVDNRDAYLPDGIIPKNPMFVYDEEFSIYKPTAADFEFNMRYPPITREEVGTTWRSKPDL